MSLVRGSVSRNKSVGFLKDRRRMRLAASSCAARQLRNVAFTRARLNLWVGSLRPGTEFDLQRRLVNNRLSVEVVGNAKALAVNNDWEESGQSESSLEDAMNAC